MDISIHKSGIKEQATTLLLLLAVTFAMVLLFHVIVYLLFYMNTKPFLEYLPSVWMIYVYALLWPIAIQNSYKAKILRVKHNGEVDPSKLRLYFINTNYSLVEERDGYMRFETKKWFDKLFKGSRNVEVTYGEFEISVVLPANQIYNLHHGFKFTNSFIKS